MAYKWLSLSAMVSASSPIVSDADDGAAKIIKASEDLRTSAKHVIKAHDQLVETQPREELPNPDYADLIARTKHIKLQPHVPHHYAEMDCRICHKMHKPSADYCSECHLPSASGQRWIIKEMRKGKLPVPQRPPS